MGERSEKQEENRIEKSESWMEQILKLAQQCLILTSTMLILNGALYPLNWFAAFARNICGLRKRSRVWDQLYKNLPRVKMDLVMAEKISIKCCSLQNIIHFGKKGK